MMRGGGRFGEPGGRGEPEQIPPELLDILERIQGWFRGGTSFLLVIALIGGAILWLASGVYQVQPGEQAVVRTFGMFTGVTQPGLNYHWPAPIQRADQVNIQQVRRAEIGFNTVRGQPARDIQEAQMLTKDENIVEVQVVVQWRVKDAKDFIFNVRNPATVLHTTTEVALRSTVGRHVIDDVLTERRAEMEEQVQESLGRLLDSYGAGIFVSAVKLQQVDAPDQVRDAFHEVVRAREDKERLQREAEAYANDVVPKARGDAERILREADGYRQERILRSAGDANRFVAVLREYQKAPGVTRERLYLETLEQALSGVQKIVMDPSATGGVLPILPLGGIQGITGGSATRAAPAAGR